MMPKGFPLSACSCSAREISPSPPATTSAPMDSSSIISRVRARDGEDVHRPSVQLLRGIERPVARPTFARGWVRKHRDPPDGQCGYLERARNWQFSSVILLLCPAVH